MITRRIVVSTLFLLFFSGCSTSPDLIFRAASVQGLQVGDKILVKGVNIGEVTELSINKKGQVNVLGDLYEDLEIPVDSKYEIITRDILGTKGIEITLGQSVKNNLKADTLELLNELPFEHALTPLLEEFIKKVDPYTKLDSLNQSLQRVDEHIQTLQANEEDTILDTSHP